MNGAARLPGLARREIAFLLIAAAGAWAGTVALARGMAGMTGTMGLGLVAFVPVWTLMMAAMVGLAALVLIEKTWRWGPAVGRLAGVAALALAVAIIWFPWLASGLHTAPMMMS